MRPPIDEVLPALGLERLVLFPGMRCTATLETVRAYGAVVEATRAWGERVVAVFTVRGGAAAVASPPALHAVGSLARVVELRREPCCGRWLAELEAFARVRARHTLRDEPFAIVAGERLPEAAADTDEVLALAVAIRHAAAKLRRTLPLLAEATARCDRLRDVVDPVQTAGAALQSALPPLPLDEQQALLELPDPAARLGRVLALLYDRLRAVGGPPRRAADLA